MGMMIGLLRRTKFLLPLTTLARLFFGGVFIYASIDKISFPYEFARIVKSFEILSPSLSTVFAYILPWIELVLGILIVVGFSTRNAAAILSFFLIVFTSAIIIKSINGTLENCGCFSTSQQGVSPPLSVLLARNIGLLLLGAYLIFFKRTIQNGFISEISCV